MSNSDKQYKKLTKKSHSSLWFEKLMALLAAFNLLLVLFDLSYIPLRDFWLQGRVQLFIKLGTFEREIPEEPLTVLPFSIAPWYDLVKGIDDHRDTKKYLLRVEDLNEKINQIALETPEAKTSELLTEAETLDDILEDLRRLSVEMIDTNPFQIANKTGTLEKIKNKMRLHIFDTTDDTSSKQAFRIFWSRENLTEKGFRKELDFFDNQIKPLIEANYYRPTGENGAFVDNFGLIDFPFFIIFGIEFLARTWYISRRRTGVSWMDAMLWRWYDVFLLIPLFRWLRIIPVTIRLHQSRLLDLNKIQKQASQGFVASIAEDLTEVVVIQVINQVQSSINEGELQNFLSQRNVREYIDINDTNETVEIAKLMANLVVCQVMPKIRPDIEALLQYTVEKVLNNAPGYQGIKQLPGMEQLQTNLTKELVKRIYEIFSQTLQAALKEDPTFDELLERLGSNFTKSIGSQMQAKQSLDKMESLLNDLLEEIKINYVERLSQEDVEEILEQTRAIRQVNKTSKLKPR